jgi:tetratricopeptide (TPR) repeat protein
LDGAIEEYSRAIALSSRLSPKAAPDSEAARVTVVDPFTANAYANRGVARYRKGDFAGAKQDFDEALRIRPSLAQAYLNRAAAKHELGDTTGALADVDKAIASNPKMFDAYNNRGALRHDVGDLRGALADFEAAIKINPRSAESFYLRGYARIDVKDYSGAVTDFDQAIKLAPNTAALAYQGRGTAWMFVGKLDQAIADFGEALSRDPNIVWAYFNRSLAFLVKGEEGLAQADFERCIALRPELKADLEARSQLARDLHRRQAN